MLLNFRSAELNYRLGFLKGIRVPKKVVLKKKDAGSFWREFQICVHSNSQRPQIVLAREFDFTEHTLLHQYEVLSVSFSDHSCHPRSISYCCTYHGVLNRHYVLQEERMSSCSTTAISVCGDV